MSTQPSNPAAQQPSNPGGTKKSFYKRDLPCPPAIAFSSPEGKQVFAEALAAGGMGGFFKLIEQYSTQDEPAFCGLASLAMVLNALSIDPRRTWKGSWRWFHEKLLDCCLPLEVVEKEGIVLSQAACLARCNGAAVEARTFGEFSERELRAAVAEVCGSGAEHIVVSYTRKAFGQTGDGHFSPLGGFHAARDLVLILDTARFKYPPHWVPLGMLYNAMAEVDAVTGQPRGYLRLASQALQDSCFFSLDIRSSCWQPAHAFITTAAFAALQDMALSSPPPPPEAAVRALVRTIPLPSLESFIVQRVPAPAPLSQALCPAPTPLPTALPASPFETPLTPPPTPDLEPYSPSPCTQANCCRSPPAPAPAPPAAQLPGTPHIHSAACHHPPAAATGVTPPPPPSPGRPPPVVPTTPTGDTRCIPVGAQQLLLHEIRCLPLHQMVTEEVEALPHPPHTQYLAEKICMLLLLQPPDSWPRCWDAHPPLQLQFRALMDASSVSIVEAEVAYLREQLVHIEEVLQYGSAHSTCAQPLDCATLGCPATSKYLH